MTDQREELRIPAEDPAQWEEYERLKRQEEQDKEKNPDHREGGVVVIDL